MKRWMLVFVLAVGILASAQRPRDFTPTECAGYYIVLAEASYRNVNVLDQLSYALRSGQSSSARAFGSPRTSETYSLRLHSAR